jgi:hypothetical protein
VTVRWMSSCLRRSGGAAAGQRLDGEGWGHRVKNLLDGWAEKSRWTEKSLAAAHTVSALEASGDRVHALAPDLCLRAGEKKQRKRFVCFTWRWHKMSGFAHK